MAEMLGCSGCLKTRFIRSSGGSFCVFGEDKVEEVHRNVLANQSKIPVPARTREQPVDICDHELGHLPRTIRRSL